MADYQHRYRDAAAEALSRVGAAFRIKGQNIAVREANLVFVRKVIADAIEAAAIADREKVAAMMMRVSIATGHGDTVDALLTELEGAIVALQVKEEDAYESGYTHGHADATREALRAANRRSRMEKR